MDAPHTSLAIQSRQQGSQTMLADWWHRLTSLLFGSRAGLALPERVNRVVSAQVAESEIIVGFMQAGAIVFFALIYAISPKAFQPGAMLEPVPWTLAIYAVFTTLRIVLALRGRLGPVFVAVSVVVDMAVLLITIWSFHLQYQAPPALYLKAPTLMYVFILIALRALRFEAGYVILAGVTAAVGWMALFLYAALADPNASFTRDYAQYVTSYQILRGAEIDKVISILMVTGVIALVVIRARKLLALSVANDVAATDLSRFFDPGVAAQIRQADMAVMTGQGVRREAAILSIDLRGFTTLSHGMMPDDIIRFLGEYQSLVVPLIEENGGSVDKYLGDGILASFGAVHPSQTYAADLCRAVDAISAAGAAWQAGRLASGLPAPGIGLAGAVGDVIFGTVGHETRLEYTVIGDVVNLVAKLEKHTKREAVRALTTWESFRIAMEQGYQRQGRVELREGRMIDGVSEPLDLIVLAA